MRLNLEQRYKIEALIKAGNIQALISKILNIHPSVISRELSRNRGVKGYDAKYAESLYETRQKSIKKATKVTPEIRVFIKKCLLKEFSPEQISGVMQSNNLPKISHKIIYQLIQTDKNSGGELYAHLRFGQKKRKKRTGVPDARGSIKNKVSIDLRPSKVDEKIEIGHWEGDLVVGANHKGFLVTLVERVTKLTLIGFIKNKDAMSASQEIIRMMRPYKKIVHTITFDNGKEFADHINMAKKLKAKIYFAHPYSSWERGLNENTNGLIRQYFLKGSDFMQIKPVDIKFVQDRLNGRPRKTLGFKTPYEMIKFKSENCIAA